MFFFRSKKVVFSMWLYQPPFRKLQNLQTKNCKKFTLNGESFHKMWSLNLPISNQFADIIIQDFCGDFTQNPKKNCQEISYI